MDWLLKLLGVKSSDRRTIKKVSNALTKTGATTKPKSASEVSSGKASKGNIRIDIEDLPYEEYEIVGESNYQKTFEKHFGPKTESGVSTSCTVLLVCERGNKFDKNAVRVEFEGDTLGYLSRPDAESFREMLDEEDLRGARVSAPARITGGWKRKDDEGHYGIVLELNE